MKQSKSRCGSSLPSPSCEHALIRSLSPYFNFSAGRLYPVGPGDDAAVRVARRRERLVFTTDCMVEGTHFTFSLLSAEEVGWKAVVANISDCIAMGARPESMLVDLVFCGRSAQKTIRQLYKGMYRACRRWKVAIVGGNLASGPCWMISITLIGVLSPGTRPLLRSGARVGDTVWVSGFPGESAAGLAALKIWGRRRAEKLYPRLVRRHVSPRPETILGPLLARTRGVHAGLDITDGVAKEARTLAYESGVGIELFVQSFPIAGDMRALAERCRISVLEWFLAGGEDYGLIFTASPSFDPTHILSRVRCHLTPIGRVVHGRGLSICSADGRPDDIQWQGWDHLKALNSCSHSAS